MKYQPRNTRYVNGRGRFSAGQQNGQQHNSVVTERPRINRGSISVGLPNTSGQNRGVVFKFMMT